MLHGSENLQTDELTNSLVMLGSVLFTLQFSPLRLEDRFCSYVITSPIIVLVTFKLLMTLWGSSEIMCPLHYLTPSTCTIHPDLPVLIPSLLITKDADFTRRTNWLSTLICKYWQSNVGDWVHSHWYKVSTRSRPKVVIEHQSKSWLP